MRFFQSKTDEARPARVRRMLALVGATALITAGGIAATAPAVAVDGGVVVDSSDMTNNTALNPMFACTAGGMPPTGGLISPELAIDFGSVTPAPTHFAIIMHDDFDGDAEFGIGDWAHWTAYNMTPAASGVTEVPRNASQTNTLLGGTEGQNTWGETGYRGPCPPPGGAHTYYFTVYALDGPITPESASPFDILAAIQLAAIDQGDIAVTFTNGSINTTSAQVELESSPGPDVTENTSSVTLPRLLVNGVVSAPATATVQLDATGCVDPGATYGTDYTHSGGSATINVTIPAGTYDGRVGTAVSIPGSLSMIDDLLVEGEECIAVRLVSVSGGSAAIGDAGHTDPIGAGSGHPGVALTTATMGISDNDTAAVPTVEFSAGTASGSESVAGTLPQLLVNGTLAAPVQVTVGVTGGTATSGTDFTAPTVVTIPAGTYDGTAATAVSIPGFAVVNDTADEPDETVIFSVTSSNTAALAVSDANGNATTQSGLTYTILDDDAPAGLPSIEFAAATGSAAEGAGGQLPLLLVNGTLAAPVQVTVSVTGGTATGADFTAPTTVTIPAGTYDGTAATGVAIPGFTITDDAVVEPDETAVFSVTSGNTAALVVGDANGNGTTVSVLTFTITNDDSAPSPSPSPSPSGGAAAPGNGNLAATGGELGSSLLIGLGLLFVGALAVIRRARKA